MKDGVNPLRPRHIECNGPCDRGERHYDEFALAGRSAIAVAVVGLQRGSRHRSGLGLIAGSTGGEAYERIGVDCDHVFPGRLPQRAARTVTVTKTAPLLQA